MMHLRSRSITAPSTLLRASLPLCPASVLRLLRYQPLELLPSHRDDRFSRSSPKPDPSSRRLYAGHQVGSNQASPHSHRADLTICSFGTSFVISTRHRSVHFRSSPWIAPDASCAPFPSTLTTKALYPSSLWRFEVCSCSRPRGAHPHLR
jgi:hypothetical protein